MQQGKEKKYIYTYISSDLYRKEKSLVKATTPSMNAMKKDLEMNGSAPAEEAGMIGGDKKARMQIGCFKRES